MRKLIVLSVALLFTACAQKEEVTKADFNMTISALTNGGALADLFDGGLMLYGVSGENEFGLSVGGNSISYELPNGTWDFYAVGWDDNLALGAASGNVYCSKLIGLLLDGSDVAINLDMSNANCSDVAFGQAADYGSATAGVEFLNTDNTGSALSIFPCKTIKGTTSNYSYATVDCSYDPSSATYVNNRGYAQSYRVVVPEFAKGNIAPPLGYELSSTCVDVGVFGTDYYAQSTAMFLNYPHGNASVGTPFKVVVQAYPQAGCSGSMVEYVLENGLLQGNGIDSRVESFIDASGLMKIVTRYNGVEACSSIEGQSANTFAAGNGSSNFPYVICNANQFNMIREEAADPMVNSYILAADIDLNVLTAAAPAAGYGRGPCTYGGDTIFPLTMICTDDQGDYDGTNDTITEKTSFDGMLDGNYHTISNLRMDFRDRSVPYTQNQGLFKTLGATAIIQNLIFEDFEIVGNNAISVLAFDAMASGSLIRDIVFKHGSVRGTNNISVVAQNAYTLENILIEDTMLEASDNNAATIYMSGAVSTVTNMESVVVNDSYLSVTNYESAAGTITINGIASSVATSSENLGFRGVIQANSYTGSTVNVMPTTNAPMYYYQEGVQIDIDPGQAVLASVMTYTPFNSNTPGGNIATASSSALYNNSIESNSACATSGTSVATMVTANPLLGTTTDNRIVLCSASQFAEIDTYSNRHYELGISLDLSTITTGISVLTNTFNGSLDGNGKFIYSSSRPLFDTIGVNGKVYDLKIFGMQPGAGVGTDIGALAITNHGVISRLSVLGLSIDSTADSTGSLVVTTNSAAGVMEYIDVYGILQASSIGSVALVNNGDLRYAKSSTTMQSSNATTSSYGYIGGLVAQNGGLLERSIFKGEIYLHDISNAYVKLGGIAGSSSGDIFDVKVSEYSYVREISASATAGSTLIGAIVGDNTGDIQRALSLMNWYGFDQAINTYDINKIAGGAGTSSSSFLDRNAVQLALQSDDFYLMTDCTTATSSFTLYNSNSISFPANDVQLRFEENNLISTVTLTSGVLTIDSGGSSVSMGPTCDLLLSGGITTMSNISASLPTCGGTTYNAVCNSSEVTEQELIGYVDYSLYSAWGIVNDSSSEVLQYHIDKMQGVDTANGSYPVWVYHSGEYGSPQILQLEN